VDKLIDEEEFDPSSDPCENDDIMEMKLRLQESAAVAMAEIERKHKVS